MPRIFAPNEEYTSTQNYLNFTNGAAAVAATDTDAIAYFTAEDCTIDNSKHKLTVMDTMTRAQINGISAYLGGALDPDDTKAEVIRKIETAVSALKLVPLTVASVPHESKDGFTVITVSEALTGTNVHKYKVHATDAPTPLYGDEADSTWLPLTSGATGGIELTTGHKITVVACTTAGFIVGSGNDTVDSKPTGD